MGETLGDKLKKTIDILKEARINSDAARAAADLAHIERKRNERKRFVDELKKYIETQIKKGKVPNVKVESFDKCEWIRDAQQGKAEFQVLWSDFIKDSGQEKLRVIVNECHDGAGMKGWLEITVEPSPHKINYRGNVRQPTPDKINMDPRPTPDPRIVT